MGLGGTGIEASGHWDFWGGVHHLTALGLSFPITGMEYVLPALLTSHIPSFCVLSGLGPDATAVRSGMKQLADL